MNLLAAVNFCSQTKSIWVLVGKILSVFKIVIPLLIIIFGMIDLANMTENTTLLLYFFLM